MHCCRPAENMKYSSRRMHVTWSNSAATEQNPHTAAVWAGINSPAARSPRRGGTGGTPGRDRFSYCPPGAAAILALIAKSAIGTGHRMSVHGLQLKASIDAMNPRDFRLCHHGHKASLKFEAVGDECFKRNGQTDGGIGQVLLLAIVTKCEGNCRGRIGLKQNFLT